MVKAAVVLCSVGSAVAHLPFVELERARKSLPAFPGEDLTFEAPFDILKESRGERINPNYKGPALTPNEPPVLTYERPDMSLYLESMLNGKDDVDYFLYNKTSSANTTWTAYGYPIIPYCKVYDGFMPEVALIGPLTVLTKQGEAIFKPVENPRFKLPEGYGAYIFSQAPAKAAGEVRGYYFAPEAQTSWWLPYGWPAECIDGWKSTNDTLRNQCDKLKKNVIFFELNEPAAYYFAFYDSNPNPELARRDVALVTGATDAFTFFDFIRVSGSTLIVSEGRSVSNYCVSPDQADVPSDQAAAVGSPADKPASVSSTLFVGVVAAMGAVIVIGAVALARARSAVAQKSTTMSMVAP